MSTRGKRYYFSSSDFDFRQITGEVSVGVKDGMETFHDVAGRPFGMKMGLSQRLKSDKERLDAFLAEQKKLREKVKVTQSVR